MLKMNLKFLRAQNRRFTCHFLSNCRKKPVPSTRHRPLYIYLNHKLHKYAYIRCMCVRALLIGLTKNVYTHKKKHIFSESLLLITPQNGILIEIYAGFV